MFEDIMGDGIELSEATIATETMQKPYPDYLVVSQIVKLTLDSHVDPSSLLENCAYIYKDNIYVTDDHGNLAYIDCEMVLTKNAAAIKKAHPEYKRTGGRYDKNDGMDAGHFGVQLGQHPSISMAQDATMNRYGTWRTYEKDWIKLIKGGSQINVKAVFVEDDSASTYSPFWCICETIDGVEGDSIALLNEADQF